MRTQYSFYITIFEWIVGCFCATVGSILPQPRVVLQNPVPQKAVPDFLWLEILKDRNPTFLLRCVILLFVSNCPGYTLNTPKLTAKEVA